MNIIMSIALKPDFLRPFQQFQLSACVAVATRQFFGEYDQESVKIKWPNDIYWRDRKLGGILIENIISNNEAGGNWHWAVVGIGININQANFETDLKNAVSLRQVTGKNFDQVDMARKLCMCIDHFYGNLINKKTDSILEMYNQYLYKKDELVKLKKGNQVFSGIVKTVTQTGQLVVQHSVEEQFDFGQIEWLL